MKITEGEETPWTILDSEYVVRHRWLTARRDRVRMANGVVNDAFFVLEYPGYEVCAGYCEKGETPEESARRELMEETGFGGGEWRELLVIAPNASSSDNYTHCFLATGVEKVAESRLEPTEELKVFLLDEAEVLDLLKSGLVIQATMVAPLWKYFCLKSMGEL